MNKDCKKEARDFDNAVHEMAYTIGQVGSLSAEVVITQAPC